jgi:excisionase family DNA binding protein
VTTPALHSIPEVCRLLGVSRRTVYNLWEAGELDFVKVRSRTFVSEHELTRYIETRARAGREGGGRRAQSAASG